MSFFCFAVYIYSFPSADTCQSVLLLCTASLPSVSILVQGKTCLCRVPKARQSAHRKRHGEISFSSSDFKSTILFDLPVFTQSIHSSPKSGTDYEQMMRAYQELVVFVAQAMMMVFACWLVLRIDLYNLISVHVNCRYYCIIFVTPSVPKYKASLNFASQQLITLTLIYTYILSTIFF
jgi:hypothetical protein